MDFKHEGEVALLFKVEILKNGENLGGFEIDPTDKNLTIGEMKNLLTEKRTGVLPVKIPKLKLRTTQITPLKEF